MPAVGSERISSIVGYSLSILQQNSPTNLPQRIAVICEANTANQSSLSTEPWQATNLKAVGVRYGYGSPAYLIARIMLPVIGGIPLVFYPQAAAVGATPKIVEITPTGTATANATHTIKIAGRDGLDGQFYNITVEQGDTGADISEKIADAVAAVIGCPMLANDSGYSSILTSKWKGATANDIKVDVDTNDNAAGISYTVEVTSEGAGTPSISPALEDMVPVWNTIGVNAYGLNTTIMSALETWNGVPDPETPTGRYVGTIMKPMIWLSGSTSEDPSAITDARKAQVTISVSPAPLSEGLPFEAAANDAAIWAVVAQNTPELDILNKFYPDMPTPKETIGAMQDYEERDRIVKLGCSTVDLVSGRYQYKDPVTTYHPEGEINPAYRWRRDLMIDFNIRYRYKILEDLYVVGKVIANDSDTVSSQNVVKPKSWKSVLISELFAGLVADGLIADSDFSAESLEVSVDESNPNRFNTFFRYKKTGVARISATEVESGFNLGTFSA